MSARRLLGTALGMGAIAGLLTALAPPIGGTWAALAAPQVTVDSAGADVLVLHAAGLLAWLTWAWGALGLALTAVSALPGLAGALATQVLRRVLPAGARRAAAIALGIGLGIAPPALGVAVGAERGTATAQEPSVSSPRAAVTDQVFPAVPDWPDVTGRQPTDVPDRAAPTSPAEVPDWPRVAQAGEHVVVRGDCLWSIAERRLTADTGQEPTSAEVALAVRAWWEANADVIGPDPDLLLPGQILRPPVLP